MNNIRFEKITDSGGVKDVASLAREIWLEHYVPIVGREQIDYMLDKFQSEKAILSQIKDEGHHYYLIKKGEKNIGYIGLNHNGEEGELLLSKIYIVYEERGKGHAREAINFIEGGLGQKIRPNKIRLTVNKNNVNSISAYLKMGFIKVDSVVTEIGSGFVMDDYIMEKIIPKRNIRGEID